jgi:hypothetical protein
MYVDFVSVSKRKASETWEEDNRYLDNTEFFQN